MGGVRGTALERYALLESVGDYHDGIRGQPREVVVCVLRWLGLLKSDKILLVIYKIFVRLNIIFFSNNLIL